MKISTHSTTHTQGFMAQDDWPDVSAMIDGFGEPSLPASDALAGRTIDIRFDDGTTIRHEFRTADELTRTLVEGEAAGDSSTHSYRAVEVRPGIQLVDLLTGAGAGTHAITMVIDLADGRVTAADSDVAMTGGIGRTRTAFLSGRIAGMGEIEPRPSSDALVGNRIHYRYSETERYEHIYLNGGTFVWHCIAGAEAGLADVDETKTFELADGIVIFHWKESVMPVESFLVVDLHAKRSIGRMFCWENSTQSVVHIPFDSRFTILNHTTYPND
ncbi:MoaF C-terminal domain-containing protein [Microbacterium sp. SD291]|uniref:MoaF C-terminal domain-containing protein n=1 Tax=Microbacterium sp. SD291 TaxID=2782007 RepID=UPI001A9674F6|nr:MoaF C-terminal domain-containing protein [Microbacterium sp. SD291]MBO0981825.1 MoaF N-terminal domain-containing protein [Microbacterium sp. SD291]